MTKIRNIDPAPVALFAFNRPNHLERTLELLSRNHLAIDSSLIIFCDGARDDRDLESVQKVRFIANSTIGFKRVSVVERERNFGLAESIIDGVSGILDGHGKIIVLEDDMETSPHFLQYMNEALIEYDDIEDVCCIHGYSFPADLSAVSEQTFFLRGAECWGWATWSDSWRLFNPDANELLKALKQQGLESYFEYNGRYPYMNMLKRQARAEIDSWAIRWRASAFVNKKLTLWPKHSLVRNIGFDGSGVHSNSTDFFNVKLHSEKVTIGEPEIETNPEGYEAFGKYLKSKMLFEIKRNPFQLFRLARRVLFN